MELFNMARATRLNATYARQTKPPWGNRLNQIISELGFVGVSPNAEVLADAIYRWQSRQPGLLADGILGPRSWQILEPHTRYSPALTANMPQWVTQSTPSVAMSVDEATSAPVSGAIPYSIGSASIIRIPLPGPEGLAIEFRPRGHVPQSGSTSTLFIQTKAGKQHLRLDYGYNKTTQSINYHWNQKGTHAKFGIKDHSPVGKGGAATYKAARYFRYAGRSVMVVGAAIDLYSVVQADRPLRRATAVTSAWALAWVGCKAVGAGGAWAGTAATPGIGTTIGGVAGCIVGGVGGYFGGEAAGEAVFNWAEDTFFRPLPEVFQP